MRGRPNARPLCCGTRLQFSAWMNETARTFLRGKQSVLYEAMTTRLKISFVGPLTVGTALRHNLRMVASVHPGRPALSRHSYLIYPATHSASGLAIVAPVHSPTYAARVPIGDGLGLIDIERETARSDLRRKRDGGEDRRREHQTHD